MSEGGCLAWKRQHIDTSRGPTATYDAVHRPLPNRPAGMTWVHDKDTKEKWRIVVLETNKNDVLGTTTAHCTEEPLLPSHVTTEVEGNSDLEMTPSIASPVTSTPSPIKLTNNENVQGHHDSRSPLLPPPQYLEHWIQDDVDTFAGLLLRYKLTAVQLRRANYGFSGTNLKLAPNPLRIPRTPHTLEIMALLQATTTINTNDATQEEVQQRRKLIKVCPTLTLREASCYLELNDWNLTAAVANAQHDGF